MHFELKGTILFCVKKLYEHALSLAHVCSDGVMGKLAGRKLKYNVLFYFYHLHGLFYFNLRELT